MVVYFDGWCPICRAARDRLAHLDRGRRLQFRSARDPAAIAETGLPAETLASSLHVRTADGRMVSGFPALVAIARTLPPLWPVWPFMVIAGWLGIGARVYAWVARNRRIVPVGACEDGACPVHRDPQGGTPPS
ncbi:MAG TPA: DUF393 domain-containing protein [Candidatus Sulfotelmatobacter sp.]|nr:DUF393 domain-containing protein [Candidatus Sulfotelmatobacter sp.]